MVETIQALGEIGTPTLLGFLLWQSIKIRKNGNGKEQLAEMSKQIQELALSVARIEGHLGITKE